VSFDKGVEAKDVEELNLKTTSAYIESVSAFGEVRVTFNTKMESDETILEQLNGDTIELSIVIMDYRDE
jgi:hypothetical protein